MSDDSQSSATSRSKKDRRLAYVFGAAFVAAILIIALFYPEPSPFQRFVFRIVLGLAAAGVAATISGFIQVRVSSGIRAGGAIGVFVIVYFFSPAQLVAPDEVGPPPPDSTSGEPDTTAVDEWAPAAVSALAAVTCRSLRTGEYRIRHSRSGDFFSVFNAGSAVAAALSEATTKKMARLAQRRTHHCVIGPGSETPVTYWHGETDADVAPPAPDRCVSYGSQDVGRAGTRVTIQTDADTLRFALASEEAAQRALELAGDHSRVCFLGVEAYRAGRHDCGERTPCWTTYWRR